MGVMKSGIRILNKIWPQFSRYDIETIAHNKKMEHDIIVNPLTYEQAMAKHRRIAEKNCVVHRAVYENKTENNDSSIMYLAKQ